MDLLKRHSISLGKAHKQKDDVVHPKTATLSMVVESPPLVSHGPPDESSGALFSGQVKLKVLHRLQTFDSIQVSLLCSKTIKKPVCTSCAECSGTTTELKKWNFTPQPLTLDVGEHEFPMSFLFKGDWPASTHSRLAMIDYHFFATAKPSVGESITFRHTVELQRAIRPGNERQSIRVFPPTNMTANVTLTPVCYTDSEIPVKMRIAGINTTQEKTITRWRLRRLLWRIEEYQKIMSPGCPKHASRVPEGCSGIKHEETRTLGEQEVNFNKTPWKTDLAEGQIDAEFVVALNPNKKAECGVVDETINLQIWHHLVLEMIVVEEYIQKKKPTQATPTGAARILRSQFPLRVTNRAGLGVAWDEETPPVYQDVPPSPPGYPSGAQSSPTTPGLAQVSEIDLTEIGDSIDDFHLGEPHELARVMGVASSSTVTRRSSGSSSEAPPPVRWGGSLRLSADDFALEPPEYRRRDEEEDEEPDVQTVAPIRR
jgi:hypothetical protein